MKYRENLDKLTLALVSMPLVYYLLSCYRRWYSNRTLSENGGLYIQDNIVAENSMVGDTTTTQSGLRCLAEAADNETVLVLSDGLARLRRLAARGPRTCSDHGAKLSMD